MGSDYTRDAGRGSATPDDELRLDAPPRGITMERTFDGTTAIRVRMFSLAAFSTLFFALGWNGVVSAFAFLVISKDVSDLPVFVWLILIPFAAMGIYLMCLAVFGFLGKCVIRIFLW